MATRISEEELAALGIMAGPNGKAVILTDKDSPDESWSLTQLAMFIHKTEQAAVGFGKAESVERFFQGHAVHLAHEKCKKEGRKWGTWCNENNINRMTPNRSERLYVAAQDKWGEEALKEVSLRTITELYVQFGILRKPGQGKPTGRDSKSPAKPGDNPDQSAGGEARNGGGTEDGGGESGNLLPFPKTPKNGRQQEPNKPENEGGSGAATSDKKAAPTKKKHEFTFSAEALATVSLREPDYFELHVEDADNGDVVLLLYRKQIENLPSQIEKAMDEDDDCDPDELPECGHELAERIGSHDASADRTIPDASA